MSSPPRYAVRGIREARDRAAAAVTGSDPDAVHIAVGETLHWLYALWEWWKDQLREDAYRLCWADASNDDGRTAGALAWARGFFTHELIEVGEKAHIYPGPNTYPGPRLTPGRFWRWCTLPCPGDEEGPDRDKMYFELVAAGELLGPLAKAERFLTDQNGTLAKAPARPQRRPPARP